MSWFYSGSASNSGSNFYLTSSTSNSVGTATLCNIHAPCFLTRFIQREGENGGYMTYTFGNNNLNIGLQIDKRFGIFYLQSNNTQISSQGFMSAFLDDNTWAVRFVPSSNQTNIRVYRNDVLELNTNVNSNLIFSSNGFFHSFTGCNQSTGGLNGRNKMIISPTINAISYNANSLLVDGSLRVNGNIFENGVSLQNKYGSNASGWISGSGLIYSSSNVGIGTTNPSTRLDVFGTFKQTATSNQVTIGSNGLLASFGTTSAQRIQLYDENIAQGIGPRMVFNAGNPAILNGGGNIAFMLSNGFGVGIGTTNVAGYNLNVAGNVNVATALVVGGGASIRGMYIGDFTYGQNTFTGFNNITQPYNSTSYSVGCDSNGNTFLNCGGMSNYISFRNSNVERALMTHTGMFVTTTASNINTSYTSNLVVSSTINSLTFNSSTFGSGTFTPTFGSQNPSTSFISFSSGVVLIGSTLTNMNSTYQRVGRMVLITGQVGCIPQGTGGTGFIFRITNLPINMGNNFLVSGTASVGNDKSGVVAGVDLNNAISIFMPTVSWTANGNSFLLNYSVIYDALT